MWLSGPFYFTLSIFWTDQSNGERLYSPYCSPYYSPYWSTNPCNTEHWTVASAQHTGNSMPPTLFDKRVGSLTSPPNHVTLKIQETWASMVYSPYPRRLERLTIWRCDYKGSTSSSVISRPWGLIRPRFEPATFCTAVRCSTNWASRSAANQEIWSCHQISGRRILVFRQLRSLASFEARTSSLSSRSSRVLYTAGQFWQMVSA